MSAAIIYHEELKEYDFGPDHPFRGSRYGIFMRFLRENLAEDDNYRVLGSGTATEDDLLLICDRAYIEFTREFYRAAHEGKSYDGQFHKFQSLDNSPIGRPGRVEEAARMVVGQAKEACRLVQDGEYKKVISIGGGLHHAKRFYGEGFCLYNDVAFCAEYLMREHGLDRIVILDTDAHAGNGTCEYFYQDPRVLFIDVHQDPRTIYPHTGYINQTGTGKGKGFTVNIPMPVRSGYDAYEMVFDSLVGPIVREFNPQLIIRNGGSDPHFDDGLTDLGLPLEGFRMIGEKVRDISEVCDGKQIDLICSGYNEHVLPYAWMALITGLADFDYRVDEPDPIPPQYRADLAFGLTESSTEKIIEEVRRTLKSYWSCLR